MVRTKEYRLQLLGKTPGSYVVVYYAHVHLLALLVVEAGGEDEVVRVRARSVLLDDLANLHEGL